MNDFLKKYINTIKTYWQSRTKKQKGIFLGSAILLIAVIGIASYFSSRTTYVPLYSNLSPSEAGTVKQSLDTKGVKYELADGGTTIKVPDDVVDTMKVELASEGLPKTGNIDYSFFSQNAGLGTTDNEFNMIKLDAMQTELSNLIKGIDGVQDAKVMINLPEKGIFVTDKGESASASIVLTVKPGYQFSDAQLKGLYQLVSKSVPNLPTDNIVIMNQYFEYYDLNNNNTSLTASAYTTNNEIKKQIERDIQRQVQTMLSTLMGPDKVVVSVSADIDFTQENREENLVTPVDKDNMKGIAVSAENIKETFTGNGAAAGGTPQSGTTSDSLGSSYVSGSGSNGDYQKTDDKVNYEVNRVRKQIVESPYKIRDLGIQVMVEPPTSSNPKSLPKSTINDISNILGTIVRTTIDKSSTGKTLTDKDIKNKVVVSVQKFNGKTATTQSTQTSIPWWVYTAGGILLLAVIVLLVLLFMRLRKRNDDEYLEQDLPPEPIYVPDVNEEQENEGTVRRKQLEKMAKEHPEDFAKLLRTWIAED